ncbi:MAG: hypothetical protein KDC52_16165, partial [Ignavibacteriae bacterium]|nr:hypothetical protein [Ignavibacteriota bacterium]
MIFNPLYFSETGNNQMLVAKPNKLSSNKYLFSDIVKVVMNNDREQKKILETDLDSIIKNGLPSIAGIENAATQIQHTELSESDNKKAKTDLADILPFDIAQLLINDDIKITEEPALSYISKEPLEGDLQKFINSLVGEEVLNQNITKETGLFLHLEDSKSAVNIELNKDSSQNAAQDKVIVQTLVVPQKSKLISMFNQTENKENKISTTKGIPFLNTTTIDIENENIISDPKSLKPTLSVYSFKNNEKSNQNLISENKGNIKLEFTNSNLSASVGKNNFSLKVPLEKISFIPSELKNQNISAKEIANTNNDMKNISETLKSIDPTIKISEKDFSVSKITIVKKQDGLNKIIDEKLNIEDKKIDSSLRKISFTDQTKIQNSELKLIKNNILNVEKPQNTNSEKLHLIKPNEALPESKINIIEGNDSIKQNKELKNNFIKQTTNVKIEKSDL